MGGDSVTSEEAGAIKPPASAGTAAGGIKRKLDSGSVGYNFVDPFGLEPGDYDPDRPDEDVPMLHDDTVETHRPVAADITVSTVEHIKHANLLTLDGLMLKQSGFQPDLEAVRRRLDYGSSSSRLADDLLEGQLDALRARFATSTTDAQDYIINAHRPPHGCSEITSSEEAVLVFADVVSTLTAHMVQLVNAEGSHCNVSLSSSEWVIVYRTRP